MIQISHLNKSYHLGGQTVNALVDVDLTINQGDYVSLMGPSGSGKSSLLNIIGLLDTADSGQYHINTVDTTELTDITRATLRQKNIGFVFQSYHLIPRLNAYDNIALPLVLAGIPTKKRKSIITPLIDYLGLTGREKHKPKEMSGGQRQRVAIARSLVMSPSVILADEPTGNLDSKSSTEVMNLLEQLNKKDNITLIIVTHDMQIGQRAMRQIQMHDGILTEKS